MSKIDVGNWFIISKEFLAAFDAEQAVLLCYLLNLARMHEDEGRVKKGWFRCSVDLVQRNLRLTYRAQCRLMNVLETKGVLRRKMDGNPAKRWLYLNLERIEACIDQAIDKECE